MKQVIITGANGNLGSAVTKKFLDIGDNVIATVANADAINSLGQHPHLDVRAVNLTDESETTTFIASVIEKYSRIDAALMLVGGFVAGGIEKTSGADLHKQIALNFETAYYVARPLFDHMLKNNYGRLVFVGARPGLDAAAGKSLIAYSLSKGLVFHLANLLNMTAKGKNVTASVIVPSTIDTPVNRKSMPNANFDDWVKAEQIADLMELICSKTGDPLRETIFKIYGNV